MSSGWFGGVYIGLNLTVVMKSFIFIAVLYLKHELHMV